jgi:hypothetical protein
MKKPFSNANPFILLLIPVLFALLMGVGYQFKQQASMELGRLDVKQSRSLFSKSISLIKTVCSIAKQDVW